MIGYIHRKILMLQLIKKINQLNIETSEINHEDLPYVKLKEGPGFYGLKTPQSQRKYYWLLSKSTRSVLLADCFQVAKDIIIRYKEAGLKAGGPEKETFYQVKKNDVVSEMGAYLGFYIIKLAEKVGQNGKVIAIEPIPENLKILKKNVSANHLTNVYIVEKGVWNEKKKLTFFRKNGDYQSGSLILADEKKNQYHIDVDSLDNIYQDIHVNFLDFIVIQLNGAELRALKGLTRFNPKNVAIAARYKENNRSSVHEIVQLMTSRGYQCQVLEKNFIFCEIIQD